MKMPSNTKNSTENALQKLTGVPWGPCGTSQKLSETLRKTLQELRHLSETLRHTPETLQKLPGNFLGALPWWEIMQSIGIPLQNHEIYCKSSPTSRKFVEILENSRKYTGILSKP